MFKINNDFVLFNDEKEVCFFDPENSLIFSKPENMNDDEAIKQYKDHIFCLPKETLSKSFKLSDVSNVSLELHVTDNCNLRCRYCYLGEKHENENNDMSEKIIAKSFDFVLNQFPNVQSIKIALFGGEPLFFWKKLDYLFEMAREKFKEKKKIFSFATNGTLMNEKIISFIKQKEVSFCISIDGKKKNHNYLRPTFQHLGSFDLIEKNLPLFMELNNLLMVRITITPYNMKITDLFEYFKKKGFKRISYALCSSSSKEFQINKTNLQSLKKELAKFSDIYLKHLIEEEAPLEVMPFSKILRSLHIGNKKRYYCENGKSLFAIGLDGKIYSCHRFVGNKKFQIGSLDGGFDSSNSIRKKLLNFDIQKQKKCETCFARNICAGGCTHEQFVLPSMISCEFSKVLLLLSIKIYYKFSKHPSFLEKIEKLLKIN